MPGDSGDPAWTHRLPCGHTVLDPEQSHYCDYLGLEHLLPLTGSAYSATDRERPYHNPDEGLFVLVHQMTEMCFARVLRRLELVRSALERDDLRAATLNESAAVRLMHHAARVSALLFDMDTVLFMAPDVGFRDLVVPASGAESIQAREIELLAGMRPDSLYMSMRKPSPVSGEGQIEINLTFKQVLDIAPPARGRHSCWWTDKLERRAGEPSVVDAWKGFIARAGLTLEDVLDMPAQVPKEKGGTHPIRLMLNALWRFERAYLHFRVVHYKLTQQHFGKAESLGIMPESDDVGEDGPKGTAGSDGLPYLGAIIRTASLYSELFKAMEARQPPGRKPLRSVDVSLDRLRS